MLPIDQIKPGWTYEGSKGDKRLIQRIIGTMVMYDPGPGKYGGDFADCRIKTFRAWAVRVVDKGEGE